MNNQHSESFPTWKVGVSRMPPCTPSWKHPWLARACYTRGRTCRDKALTSAQCTCWTIHLTLLMILAISLVLCTSTCSCQAFWFSIWAPHSSCVAVGGKYGFCTLLMWGHMQLSRDWPDYKSTVSSSLLCAWGDALQTLRDPSSWIHISPVDRFVRLIHTSPKPSIYVHLYWPQAGSFHN